MEASAGGLGQLTRTSRRFARRLLTLWANRLELLTIEVQEEREHLLRALLLALAAAAFGLLAALTFTAAIVVEMWAYSPVAALLILTGLYGGGGIYLCRRLIRQFRNWETLSGSLDQLRKDRRCLGTVLS